MGLQDPKNKTKAGMKALIEKGFGKLDGSDPEEGEALAPIDADDFETFEGGNIMALRDAHSNQRRQFAEEEGEEEGEDADVRVGGEEASLEGSRKRQRQGAGAPGTSSLSPSIRI